MDAPAALPPTASGRTLLAGVLALVVALAVVLLPMAGPAAAADPAEDRLVARWSTVSAPRVACRRCRSSVICSRWPRLSPTGWRRAARCSTTRT